MSTTIDQEIARVKALRAPLMQYRQSQFSALMTTEMRAQLKTYDDAIRAAENAISAGDADAQATALTTLQGLS